MDNCEILNLTIKSNDFEYTLTIRDYFKQLLKTLWEEGESFSGKRPFGNSGWEYDVYASLISGGVIAGELDEFGGIEEVDIIAADALVFQLIEECFTTKLD